MLTFLMILSSIGNMLIPLLQKQIVDRGIIGGKIEILIALVLYTICLQILISLLLYRQNKIQVEINCDFEKKMQLKVMTHLFKIRKDILDKEGVLKLSKNADFCIETLSSITGSSVLQMMIEVFKLIGIVIALVLINWKIALFSFAFLPLKFLITTFVGKYAQKYSDRSIEEHQNMHRWEEDVFSTIPEIKLWNLQEKKTTEYATFLTKILDIIKKSNLLMAKDTQLGDGLAYVIFNLLYLIAGFMIWGNTLTIGGLLVITSYFTYVLEPVSLFSSISLIFSNVKPAIDRLEEYMNLPEENEVNMINSSNYKETEVEIEFEDVSYSYGNIEILKNVNLSLHQGKKYALIGENGSGKSTLVNLLLRFVDLKQGLIKLNGIDINSYSINDYRNYFGVVTQQSNLFNASIADNISVFGRYELKNETVDSEIFQFIKNMPLGINSEVGNKSTMLSGGEKQKIALARAISSHPKILLLDEPTSNYDAESKHNFYELLRNITCTTIIISHEKELLEETDYIVFLERGKVRLFDSYEEFKNNVPNFFNNINNREEKKI